MVIKNLAFFGNTGYNLNFEWNSTLNVWEGNIYLPKVSVGLYANTNIYVMEKIGDNYYFPQKGGSEDKIKFRWDFANMFVDEFFMFTFDDMYYGTHEIETSALTYTPNNGPEVETLMVNKFEEYEVELDDQKIKKVLPIHVAFSSPEMYDANTFKRTLKMYYGYTHIANITFFAETVEEDERLKVLTSNLGYNIKPDETIIFKKSDVKECYPDYQLLNEKRKELLIEGHNIYPYVGSYKALINAIKFFGYENLNIIEFWRNVDVYSENFGKLFASEKYSLSKKSSLVISGNTITLPNRNYRKTNELALVYTINHPLSEVDDMEIPLVKEDFEFTLEEILIKLFALRRKLNSDFVPCSSRIVDIIGEATYFGLQEILNNAVDPKEVKFKPKKHHYGSIKKFPSDVIYITDNRPFLQYVTDKMVLELNTSDDSDSDSDYSCFSLNNDTPISSIYDRQIDEIGDKIITDPLHQMVQNTSNLGNVTKVFCYENYYTDIYVDFIEKAETFEPNVHRDEDDIKPTAKVVLENTSFNDVCFSDIQDKFKTFDTYEQVNSGEKYGNATFDNIGTIYYGFRKIKWKITFSDDQLDEDWANADETRIFEDRTFTQVFEGDINEYNKVFVELPYVGYYDVELSFTDNISFDDSVDLGDSDSDSDYEPPYNDNLGFENYVYIEKDNKRTAIYTFKKALKVEPFSLDVRGFYYDARELPDNLKYKMLGVGTDEYGYEDSDSDADTTYIDFINDRLTTMTNGALVEHFDASDIDKSMPYYATDGSIINPGPYAIKNLNQSWCLFDNIDYDISKLEPNVDDARYIKNGVDVKPYTWFLLGFDESKITSVKNPHWVLKNIGTEEMVEHYGRYFTLLLKKEGDYNITLDLEDSNGNKYSISRNIIVVDKNANYKLYRRFKEDYEAYIDEKNDRDNYMIERLIELNKINNI